MKVKIFTNEGNIAKLEDDINRWLREKNVSISSSHIKQNFIYDSKDNVYRAFVSVWYEADFEK